MALPIQPPTYPSFGDLFAPIKRGEKGWRVYAVQRCLNAESYIEIAADGDFGPATEAALKEYQTKNGISPVGYAGPGTQKSMLAKAEHRVHADLPRLPEGVLLGFAVAEGASLLAATNWYTPPGGDPGVDCGPVQWRQYGPPFSQEGMKKAFYARSAFQYAGEILLERIDDFNRRRPSLTDEMVLRIAILAHNAPFLADQIVKNGKLSTPDALAKWTSNPDGSGPYTHAEWLEEYPNRILAYVNS